MVKKLNLVVVNCKKTTYKNGLKNGRYEEYKYEKLVDKYVLIKEFEYSNDKILSEKIYAHNSRYRSASKDAIGRLSSHQNFLMLVAHQVY